MSHDNTHSGKRVLSAPFLHGVVDRLLRRLLLAGVHGYQRWLGWLMGGHCRFVPSCSCYAEEALFRGPLHWAVLLTVWRLLRCQPFCRGGFDPVPDWMGARPELILRKGPGSEKKS